MKASKRSTIQRQKSYNETAQVFLHQFKKILHDSITKKNEIRITHKYKTNHINKSYYTEKVVSNVNRL